MFNDVFHQHQQTSPSCGGRLDFDYNSEQQRMLCWREKVKCDRCEYVSQRYNLYDEIKTGKAGRKSATANVGLNIGLSNTQIGPSSVRKLCLSTNIPAPSRRGMQKCANAVSKTIETVNKSDMQARRQTLKTINLLRGQPETEISVQCDGMFNNPLFSGIGNTPFQPATQCSYSVVENVTKKKQVIAMENVSKLCSKHGYHSGTDQGQCDIKSEKCSATIPMEQSIGDERQWAKACLLQLREDQLQVKYITTDPDTSAYKAAEDLRLANVTTVDPIHQIDTRHLSQNHRKHIKNKSSLLDMMPGGTKKGKTKNLNNFATDLSMRCQSEFENIHRQTTGNTLKLQKYISVTTDAITACYQGDHKLCKLHSTVCVGEVDNNWLIQSQYLCKSFKLMVKKGSEKTLRECIDYRLGPNIVEKTKLNSNSQKVESVNNVIRHSLPKNVTFARNFSGRAHCAVFKSNNGPGEAILKLCEATGCPIPSNGKVSAGLLSEQKCFEANQARCRSTKRKMKRKFRRNKLYKLYEKHQEKILYQKAQLLLKNAKTRQLRAKVYKDHCYTMKNSTLRQTTKNDHTYSASLNKNKPSPTKCKVENVPSSSFHS